MLSTFDVYRWAKRKEPYTSNRTFYFGEPPYLPHNKWCCPNIKAFFTLGVKAGVEKIFSICPKFLITAELHGLVLAPRLKKGCH